MKKSSLAAQHTKRKICCLTSATSTLGKVWNIVTHPVRVIEIQYPASVLVHLFVALIRPAHDKCGIHVDVVTGKVQRDQALEEDGPPREGRRQEDEEARSRAAIRDHIKYSAEARALLVQASGVTVEGVEKTRDAVENGACSWVQRHIVEGCYGKNDS